MKKHYLLHLNPQASHEWDQCVLRNPITGERPDLVKEIQSAIPSQAGCYLISVEIDVQVLEQMPLPTAQKTKEITSTKTTVVSVPSTKLRAS